MATIKYIYFLLLIGILASCGPPPVLFDQPQPPKGSDLRQIPKRLRGEYISMKDSSFLIVNDKSIYRTSNLKYKMPASKIDSGYVLKGDSLVNIRTNEKIPVSRIGESFTNL